MPYEQDLYLLGTCLDLIVTIVGAPATREGRTERM